MTVVTKAAADADGYVYPLGVPIRAGAYFPYLVALSIAVQVLVLPVVGAIADQTQRKRELLGVTAYDVTARMKYKGLSLEDAARETIKYLTEIKGEGGLIAVDRDGNVTLPFNSEGMYRGFVSSDVKAQIDVYGLEPPE